MPPRAVVDTNVLYTGLRSRNGASFQILDGLWQRRWILVLSNTILTEYEEVLKRNAPSLGLTVERVDALLDAFCALAECHEPAGFWTPILPDPDDEAFVQLAVGAKVSCLVSHNLRHLAPARAVGVNLLAPRDFLAMLKA
ncbi:MAG: putative toxin-antitoxin system toxin component, PIN family [Verrucomicrobia bacterium]|nr:putative toxin-antitoxin system toxin component, PIN family [Verrucomicrobiota bacterium]